MRMVYKGKLLVFSALTRAMNRLGYDVHVSHVSRVLRGERDVSKDFASTLGKVLGISDAEAREFIEEVAAAISAVEALPLLVVEEEGDNVYKKKTRR